MEESCHERKYAFAYRASSTSDELIKALANLGWLYLFEIEAVDRELLQTFDQFQERLLLRFRSDLWQRVETLDRILEKREELDLVILEDWQWHDTLRFALGVDSVHNAESARLIAEIGQFSSYPA